MKPAATLAILLALPGVAHAQARSCAIPRDLPRPTAEGPSASEPARLVPIGGYTLALSWSPQYCRTHRRDADEALRCGGRTGRFGFTLHGLWPDGRTVERWPQYCTATALLPEPVIRSNVCNTPSVQLIQHEWAKHGTCTGLTPSRYFGESAKLYRAIRYPDMNRLSRRRLNAFRFRQEFARVNSGLSMAAIRVIGTHTGWLDEVWLCLDPRLRPRACPAGSGGLPPGTQLRIWRG